MVQTVPGVPVPFGKQCFCFKMASPGRLTVLWIEKLSVRVVVSVSGEVHLREAEALWEKRVKPTQKQSRDNKGITFAAGSLHSAVIIRTNAWPEKATQTCKHASAHMHAHSNTCMHQWSRVERSEVAEITLSESEIWIPFEISRQSQQCNDKLLPVMRCELNITINRFGSVFSTRCKPHVNYSTHFHCKRNLSLLYMLFGWYSRNKTCY